VRKPRGGSGTGHLGLFAQAELLKLQKSGQFDLFEFIMNR
jgi:hypothetical protein